MADGARQTTETAAGDSFPRTYYGIRPKDMPLVAWVAGLTMQGMVSTTPSECDWPHRGQTAAAAVSYAEALVEELHRRGHIP